MYAFVTNTGASHSLTTCGVPGFSSTITCTSGTFSAADVGASISSANATLDGNTISAVTSGTVATLGTANGFTAISGASITVTDAGNNAVYQFAATFTSGTGSGATAIGTGGGGFYL